MTTTFDARYCPIYITCRDRVSDLTVLVDWLLSAGHERVHLLDNDSSYEPLLEYYERTPVDVIRLSHNLGSRALWRANMVPSEPFVLTDPDVIPTEDCPLDAVEYLWGVLERHREQPKAALGLYLEDTPAFQSLGWERSLVRDSARLAGGITVRELEPGVFGSMADTTFAVWRPHVGHTLTAARCGPPSLYMARHTSWYRAGQELSSEEDYYLRRAIKGPLGSSWAEGKQV